MKKVVINTCYGGFGLSAKAISRYMELKGEKAFFYVQTKYPHRDGVSEYTRITEGFDQHLCKHILTKDLGETHPTLNGSEIDDHYFSEYNISRDDPDLITVVEEMGEEANGQFANLKIVKIPDEVEYSVEEYDGMEWIAENHRTWS